MTTRTAYVAETITAIAHTGRGIRIPAGEYRVAELDATAADGTPGGALYVYGPTGALVGIDGSSHLVTIVTDRSPTTAEAAYTELPGITHALGVISQERGMDTRTALVLFAAGALMERDLRSGNGYNGHTILDLAVALNQAVSGDDMYVAVANLIADRRLVVASVDGGWTHRRWTRAMADPERGSRWGDVYANLVHGARVVVRIPETIEVAR